MISLFLLTALFVSCFKCILSLGFRSSPNLPYRVFGRYSCNNDDDDAICTDVYTGPEASLSLMEAGIAIEELGIQVTVGPSTIFGTGRGLFLSILDDVESVVLPAGTPISGYSKGMFQAQSEGDKAVAYSLQDPAVGIIFEKQLRSLAEVIWMLDDNREQSDDAVASPDDYHDDASKFILGHSVHLDRATRQILHVAPDPAYGHRYFIPFFLDEKHPEIGPSNIGMFANDIAYYDGVTEDDYRRNSAELNVLQLVWRMTLDEQQRLAPTWPVVITMNDLKLTNRVPMEVGVQYGWRYWQSSIQQLRVKG